MKVTVNGRGLHGSVPAIASKSMAHRLLICAALSNDPSHIRCETLSDDISITSSCLRALGCELTYTGGTFYAIPGNRPKKAMLDCRESDSTLLLLLPVIAALGITCRIDMAKRLPKRHLSPLYKELVNHGSKLSPEDSNPLLLSGKLKGGYIHAEWQCFPTVNIRTFVCASHSR